MADLLHDFTLKQAIEQNLIMNVRMRRHGDCIGNYTLVNALGSILTTCDLPFEPA